MYTYVIIFIVLFQLITNSLSTQDACSNKQTCGDCISVPNCVWCSKPIPQSSGKTENCKLKGEINWCLEDVIDPESNIEITSMKPLQTSSGAAAVQISPQSVNLQLRVGEEFKLDFSYAQAEDYPVDLYFLMDLSASMEPHKTALSKLGTKLASEMRKLTKNIRLGFGSFVDKIEMPFSSTLPERLENPCPDRICVPPYSFINQLSLTNNISSFIMEVWNARVSGNVDGIEGGFDALLQAMVCTKEIGWRDKARHILVFSTDAGFHIAGDGKLAGIVEPNDGLCHMDGNTYTHALKLDYPSIGQINQMAKEKNMYILFAVLESQKSIYTKLKNRVRNSEVGFLLDDSSNVVDLIKKVYEGIVDSVTISDNAADHIEVKYFSSCTGNNYEETNTCNNLRVGTVVNYTAVIKLNKCPTNENGLKSFQIRPGGLDESLIVNIQALCSCECESPESPSFVKDSPECSNSGSLQCGICSCNDGKFGNKCECDGSSTSNIDDYEKCRQDNSSEVCSGSGTCKCGQCVCNLRPDPTQLISGKFCECKNYTCGMKNGQMCSSNGHCNCGNCKCDDHWTGPICNCTTRTDKCFAPNTDQMCSDRGECNCGKCKCQKKYTGQHCEVCPTCKNQCKKLQRCVECLGYESGDYDQHQCSINCQNYNLTYADKIVTDSYVFHSSETLCHLEDKDGCLYMFKFIYDETGVFKIAVPKEKICKTKITVFAIIMTVVGSILLAGIVALIVWKVFTTIHDQREYAKFEQERKKVKWSRGENPLFRNPLSTFKNPVYSKHD